MSRLALLVPARNAGAHLGRLLDSAAAQTTPFDEVWLFDDASEDDTGTMARERGARVVRSEVCVGPSAGKNELAGLTSCEWVHFHDADEALGPDFVTRARAWMADPAVDVVVFATEDREEETGAARPPRIWDDAALARDAVAYGVSHTITNCGIYRRDAFVAAGGFDLDEAVKYNEDQAMHLRLALAGLRFRADPYVGVIVYRRAGSMSSGHPVECARAQVDVLRKVVARTGDRYRSEMGPRLWRLAAACAGYGDWAYVDASLALCREIGYERPSDEHWAVQAMARISPGFAVRARERMIRTLKPRLRAGMARAADLGERP